MVSAPIADHLRSWRVQHLLALDAERLSGRHDWSRAGVGSNAAAEQHQRSRQDGCAGWSVDRPFFIGGKAARYFPYQIERGIRSQ